MVFKKGDPRIYRRPKKVNLDEPQPQSVGTNATATLPLQSHGFDLVLGIRRIRGGNFTGLWELSELSVNANQVTSKRVMTDANIKPILLTQIGRRLSKCF